MPRRSQAKGPAGWRLRDETVKQAREQGWAFIDDAPKPKPPVTTFDPATHEYRINGVVVPSVTQVLNDERCIDFSAVPDRILADAQARGTYVHTVLHYYLEGDFDLADCDPRYRGYVDSALAYLDQLGKTPLPTGAEYRFWHVERMFAGCADYVGFDRDGVLSIDDWKTGEPSDVAAPLQLAAYECGVRHCFLPTLAQPYAGHIRRRAVKLFRDGSPARPDPYTDPRDLALFFAALACVHYRRNGMRHGAP